MKAPNKTTRRTITEPIEELMKERRAILLLIACNEDYNTERYEYLNNKINQFNYGA